MYVPDILTAPLRQIGPTTWDYPFLDDGEVQIGIWETTPVEFPGPTGDYDEAMFMVSGRSSITHPEGVYDIAPGSLWTTPRHWAGAWSVHQTVRKMYVIDNRAGAAATPAHQPNVYTADLGAAKPRPVVISGDPRERSVAVSSHNRLEAGVWECTPGTFPMRRDGYDEVFCVLSGHATMHIDGGLSFDLRPGSMLLTPAGTTGTWVVHETLRKAYMIVSDRG